VADDDLDEFFVDDDEPEGDGVDGPAEAEEDAAPLTTRLLVTAARLAGRTTALAERAGCRTAGGVAAVGSGARQLLAAPARIFSRRAPAADSAELERLRAELRGLHADVGRALCGRVAEDAGAAPADEPLRGLVAAALEREVAVRELELALATSASSEPVEDDLGERAEEHEERGDAEGQEARGGLAAAEAPSSEATGSEPEAAPKGKKKGKKKPKAAAPASDDDVAEDAPTDRGEGAAAADES